MRTMPRRPARSRSGCVACASAASVHIDKGIVREKVLALCNKRAAFVQAYAHPGCHRTSDLVDRLLRRLDYHLSCAQDLHGSTEAAEEGLRGWASLHDFAPRVPGRFERLRVCGARRNVSMVSGITPSGSRTCWSQPPSVDIADSPKSGISRNSLYNLGQPDA